MRRDGGGGPASALRTEPSESAPTVARLPAGKTGAAQEGAAVEAAHPLVGDRAGKRTATRLTLGPFDQHGRLLTSLDSD